uniref:NADH-ubiquinone oxidoreductase chain 4 n=1 Tax=Topsentia ophiraphidites TaxID=281489 RepID=I6LIH6_TOPOP|nr:NADH dehydrogenase subunit 4 [Topsentia ophiraphidites]ABW83857.1 NADH dehydrogenase subunit 4 [Topsentia ophiraphidites]
MLELVFILPLIGILNLLIIPRDNIIKLKKTALEWSLFTLTATILLWASFDGSGQFQAIINFEWIPGTEPVFGPVLFAVDGISIFFLILTAVLIPICILISWNSPRFLIKEFLLCLLAIEVLLLGVFTVLDLIGFYILFEGILIPMFLIIGIWGSREEKVQASYYFFFYTFLGSVFMLLAIFILYSHAGTTDYQALCGLQIKKNFQYFIFLGFFLSLAIKIPKIPFHIWLPLAHVEAPVAGSVILAGVLLKLGGYGFIRFSWPLLPEASKFFAPLILTLSLLAIIYGSLTTCRQVDLKRIIAYSSVAHMGLVTLGIFSHTVQGLVAAIFLMLAHGLVSSALFIAVTFLYDRHHTRIIKYYRGMAITMPLFGVSMLTLMLANASIPLSCNFVGEFLSLLAAFEYSIIVGVLASLGIVLSAGYSIYLYNRACFGAPSKYLKFSRDLNRRELYSIIPLVILIYLIGIFPSIIIDVVKSSIIFQEW